MKKLKMLGRNYNDTHRAATPLELFFDLIFVIAIASAASNLHHQLAEHHIVNGIFAFFMSFFSIWWAWMNFTWFASAYDTDDTPFRLTTFLLMFGALIFAIGINDLFSDSTRPFISVLGFVIMRIAMAIHWLRASFEDPKNKIVCLRYAFGIIFAQLCWVSWVFLPAHMRFYMFFVFMLVELAVPLYAEGKQLATSWHPHHIAERYGLLIIIVLGEGLLGTSNTIAGLLKNDLPWASVVIPLGLTTASIIFALWWTYFELPWGKILKHNRNFKYAFIYGYLHFFIFASLAAVGSSLELIADSTQAYYSNHITAVHNTSPLFAVTALSTSIAIYLITLSILRLALIGNTWNNWLALATSLIAAIIPAISVLIGLEIIWALALTSICIILYISFCNWNKCNYYHQA
ncbi:low temperature requirement protein A [Aestuariibaculum sediminum]|uniref:Low temperature requirement protein A n=1 Tax=Aestuariibaculum sediminum TaxID=2770637 RepID=A0A8J6Q2K8_9FLAO|nr:low temperature requirement protein A [Aestuariibaculum sediminum]MBD0832271.1 low temperature requirement protein A [Aestuariibaculum sediminum]